MIPRFDGAEEFGGPSRKLHLGCQPEIRIHALHQPQQPLDFLSDLRLHDEAVRVVLAELADACQARQHARRLVPVKRRLFMETDRQIAIAPYLARIHQEVAGAVHRLEPHLLAFALDEKHVLPVVLPVSGGLPERLVEHDGRLHFHVTGRGQHPTHVVSQGVVDDGSLSKPERGARRPGMKHEQLLIAAYLAVVALLRFFEAVHVRLQILVGEERGPVDALHRLVASVALPIGVRRAEQLERLEATG